MDTNKLLRMKQMVDDAKVKESQLQGKKEILEEHLQEMGIDIDHVDQEIEALREKQTRLEEDLATGITRLEEEFDWN